MIVYWLLFAYFATGALLRRERLRLQRDAYPMVVVGGLIIAVLVGFRYQVGADWRTYGFMFEFAGYTDLERVLRIGDPGYQFLNWMVQQLGAEIWLVNLVCGLVFGWGLTRFARAQRDPWLAMVVAVPYLVIVVGMGYSRQAVAIGILMAGLATFERSASVIRFAAYAALAGLFHKTAIIAFPLVILGAGRTKFVNALLGLMAFLLLYDALLGDSVERFVERYIESEYSSEGAAIRVAMNIAPALLFLLNRHRFDFPDEERSVWRNFSLAAIALLVLLLMLPSSTAVDRIALYVMPLQVAVLSRVPGALVNPVTGKLLVVGYCVAVQFVWLNYASHADHWVPYQFYPL